MRLPTESATDYAKGFIRAKNGSIEDAAKQACAYDGVSQIWWRLVRRRLLKSIGGTQSLRSRIIWKFDIFIYSLFYWRWKRRLEERQDIRDLFLRCLSGKCVTIHSEEGESSSGIEREIRGNA